MLHELFSLYWLTEKFVQIFKEFDQHKRSYWKVLRWKTSKVLKGWNIQVEWKIEVIINRNVNRNELPNPIRILFVCFIQFVKSSERYNQSCSFWFLNVFSLKIGVRMCVCMSVKIATWWYNLTFSKYVCKFCRKCVLSVFLMSRTLRSIALRALGREISVLYSCVEVCVEVVKCTIPAEYSRGYELLSRELLAWPSYGRLETPRFITVSRLLSEEVARAS